MAFDLTVLGYRDLRHFPLRDFDKNFCLRQKIAIKEMSFDGKTIPISSAACLQRRLMVLAVNKVFVIDPESFLPYENISMVELSPFSL